MRRIVFIAALLLAAPAAAQDAVHDALDAYALYQTDISAVLDLAIEDEDAMNTALERVARHDPARVSRGWIAYGALTAAQSPAFVAGVRSRVGSAGRAPVLRQLNRDITYARRRPPGADEAIALILNANAADTSRMSAAGNLYQGVGDAWAVDAPAHDTAARREARNTRLASLARERRALPEDFAPRLHIGALAATPLTDTDAFGGARFWDALAARTSPRPAALRWREANTAITNRMLTLAGLIITNAVASETTRVTAMLDDEHARECLAMQQLQFRQCVSVSNYPNEDAYCLARHGLTQPGACLSIAAAP